MREDQHAKKIKEIMGQMQCPHDSQCSRSGLKDICGIEDAGILMFETEECICPKIDSDGCAFATSFEGVYLCNCPLRLYLVAHSKQ